MRVPEISQRTVLASLEPVLCAVGLAIAALSFRTFYGDWLWFLPVVGAVVLATSVGVVANVRRWSWVKVTLAAVLSFIVYGLYAVYPGELYYGLPTLAGIRDLGDGMVSGWANML